MGKHNGRVAGIVARSRLLLFVTGFMFLIYNDEAEILLWQKDRGTHSYNQLKRLVATLLLPYFQSLCISASGVINAHFIAKNAT